MPTTGSRHALLWVFLYTVSSAGVPGGDCAWKRRFSDRQSPTKIRARHRLLEPIQRPRHFSPGYLKLDIYIMLSEEVYPLNLRFATLALVLYL